MLLSDEANRCLLCKNPRCRENCPIDTPIPEVIELYKQGKLLEAGEILFNNNPLSAICSLVCIHENQCLGNCVRGIKGEPVHFHNKETEISSYYLNNVKFEKNIMVDQYEEKLIELGVKIRPNTLIGPVITLDRLFEDGYKAAFIGAGNVAIDAARMAQINGVK
ncbi:MAG: dihydropyrimidine dehydrogenase [Clostridiaceae bacterium]|jgi:glutamate synthase (NADPH/NADH) small chain|nr:dihydropyrimidine dehydrogenase [Clostridiaceae bacterium]